MVRLCTLASLFVFSSATTVSTHEGLNYCLSQDSVSLVQAGVQIHRHADGIVASLKESAHEVAGNVTDQVKENANSVTDKYVSAVKEAMGFADKELANISESVKSLLDKAIASADKIEEVLIKTLKSQPEDCASCAAMAVAEDGIDELLSGWSSVVKQMEPLPAQILGKLDALGSQFVTDLKADREYVDVAKQMANLKELPQILGLIKTAFHAPANASSDAAAVKLLEPIHAYSKLLIKKASMAGSASLVKWFESLYGALETFCDQNRCSAAQAAEVLKTVTATSEKHQEDGTESLDDLAIDYVRNLKPRMHSVETLTADKLSGSENARKISFSVGALALIALAPIVA